MTDENTQGTDAEGVDWGGATPPDWQEATAAVAAELPRPVYPEYPALPEAPISINFKVTGEPMITVRGNDGAQITAILNDLSNNGVWANIAAAQADLRTQGGVGAGLGPVTPVSPQAPPPGFPQGPPVESGGNPPFGPPAPQPQGFPGQFPPSFQSGPPPQQQWQGQGGFGGGGNFQSDDKPQPAAQPPGWYRVNARSGPGFDAWKNLREQQKDFFKGKIKWGGKSDYWIEPSIAQGLAGMGFAVSP